MRRRYLLALPVCLLFFISCTRVSLFNSPLETEHEVEVRSLAEGGLLTPGESVTFLIHSPLEDGEALNLEITLSSAFGVELWRTQIASPLVNEELELLLPDMETGQYRLTFVISQEEGGGSEKTFDFFYAVGEYKILGIRSYPPTPYPSSQTILKADLLYPAGSDPYLRWRQDGEILAAGFISGGMDEIIWSAPEAAGVYSLEVELFPAQPSGGGSEALVSSVSLTASLYVSTQNILSENDLSPESSYFSLFHFNGTLRDSGVQGKTVDREEAEGLELFGAPVFGTVGDHFGYRLTPGSGLRYAKVILPLEEGRLAPFTLTLSLVPGSGNAGKTLLSSGQAEQGFLFSLQFDKDEQLLAVLEGPAERHVIPSGIAGLRTGQEYFVSLSLLPGEERLTAAWFLDGQPVSRHGRAARLEGLPAGGRTVIGGEVGLTMTELGVYFRDEQARPTIDPSVFAAARERELGGRLIFADGFDGQYAAAPEVITGPYALQDGLLRLAVEAALTLPSFEPTPEGVGLSVVFPAAPPKQAFLSVAWEDGGEPFLFLPATAGEPAAGFTARSVLTLTLTDTAYSLGTATRSTAIPPRPEGAWLVVRLINPPPSSAGGREETPSTLDVEQLTLYHNGTREAVAAATP